MVFQYPLPDYSRLALFRGFVRTSLPLSLGLAPWLRLLEGLSEYRGLIYILSSMQDFRSACLRWAIAYTLLFAVLLRERSYIEGVMGKL